MTTAMPARAHARPHAAPRAYQYAVLDPRTNDYRSADVAEMSPLFRAWLETHGR